MCDCPKTLQLLELVKILGIKINIAGYTLLLPNTKLQIHNDPNTGISSNTAAFNMPLTGTDCYLYMKDSKYLHQNGKAVLFNSEIDHYADNNGSTNRFLLYMDIGY